MEMKEVWGWEIAIRSVVRKISLLGVYLGRAGVGQTTSCFMRIRGLRELTTVVRGDCVEVR